jgi:hypothetical protein
VRSFPKLEREKPSELTVLGDWLSHSDPWQVYDLPTSTLYFLRVSDPAVIDRELKEGPFGKSQTCR